MICPICGHTKLNTTYEDKSFRVLYGPPIVIRLRVDTCPACNESGDFENENDRPIQQALEISALKSVPFMVAILKEDHQCAPVYIERVTGLQFGSITRCEAGHYDAAVIIALRMACAYPPILALLDNAESR